MSATAAAVVGVVAATAAAATVIAAATATAVSAITEEDNDKDNEPENAVVTTVAEHDCSLSPHFRFMMPLPKCADGGRAFPLLCKAAQPWLHRSSHNMRLRAAVSLFRFLRS